MEMEMDEIFNITEMPTTPERDFLLRSNGDKVKVDRLKGKMIGFHFLEVGGVIEFQQFCCCRVGEVIEHPQIKVAANLLDAYEEHYSKGDFEVVFVAIMDKETDNIDNVEEETFFNQQFSRMPWLAVPFSDIKARRKLTKAFVLPILWRFQSCSFLDANGRLLAAHVDQLLYQYAADFYPFTYQREEEIIEENKGCPCMTYRYSLSWLLPTATLLYQAKGIRRILLF